MLRKIGWDVWTSLQEGRRRGIQDAIWSEIIDAHQLTAARDLNRILVTFDIFRGKSGAEVAAELQLHGGKVVQIAGGPQQSTYRACAKLLWHFNEWMAFLEGNDGVVILSDLRQTPRLYTVEEYNQRTVTTSMRQYFEEYTEYWRSRPLPEPIPRPTLTPEQRLLTYPLPEDELH